MIVTIHGKVIQKGDDHLVVELNGMGFKVFAPASTCQSTNEGETIFLFTHFIVREDHMALYGFENEEQRNYFILFLSVNGIGPRTALAVLSTLNLDAIKSGLVGEKVDVFSRVPGIGNKTAAKIILQLQGKIPSSTAVSLAGGADVESRIFEALVGLGYSVVEAQAALQSIPKDAPNEEEIKLKLALRYFAGGK